MLFAFNSAGVPSVARIVNVPADTTVLPNLTISPSTLVFAAQSVGTSSAPLAIAVTNTTAAPLPAPNITFTDVDAGQFSQTNTCGASIAANSSCAINVVFAPTSTGDIFANLHVNGSGLKLNALVKGAGLAAYTVSPATLAFGKVAVNTTSAPLAVTVTNQGSVALRIAQVPLSGPNTDQFAMTNTCGVSLAPRSNCAINVVFAPTSVGNLRARLLVSTQGVTHSSTLTGRGK